MYYCDMNGLVWRREGDVFRNIGLSVHKISVNFKSRVNIEKNVSFDKISSIEIIPGSVMLPDLSNAIPTTIREAVNRLNVTEFSPLLPIKFKELN